MLEVPIHDCYPGEGMLLPGFRQTCVIEADLKHLSGALEQQVGIHGEYYWTLSFDVCIRFGGTELEAYVEWEENVGGVMQYVLGGSFAEIVTGGYSYRASDDYPR